MPSPAPSRVVSARRARAALALAAALCLAVPGARAALPWYDVVALPDVGDGATLPNAMNNRGAVTGEARLGKHMDGEGTAYVLRGKRVTRMHQPAPGQASEGRGINDHGVVVGNEGLQVANGEPRGFIWDRHGVTRLDVPTAMAITNDGTVVGDFDFQAIYRLRQGQYHLTGLPPEFSYGFAKAANARGDVLVDGHPWNGTPGYRVLVHREDTGWTDHGTLGGDFANGLAINRAGTVVGLVYWNRGSGRTVRAFVLKDGVTSLFGSDAVWAEARLSGINEAGVAVGSTRGPDGEGHAFAVDTDGQSAVNLNRRLAAGHAGWTLLDARAINDRGEIVGRGLLHGQSAGFLLVPRAAH
ncbi:hypothetical protein [Ideonella sp.]|uniref:hypothetical protein n=1 Tax=Ideonella sp. TaxID=1929293 RepID=UPI0035B0FCB6